MSDSTGVSGHQRGVYRQQFGGPNGNEVITVIDRDGNCLAFAILPERANRAGVTRSLRHLLRHLDPPPPLRLIR